jgi:hypothetical protein
MTRLDCLASLDTVPCVTERRASSAKTTEPAGRPATPPGTGLGSIAP